MSATMTRPAIVIPDREALLRDGIPPELMQHFRRQAVALRAQAFKALFHRLRAAAAGRREPAQPLLSV